MFPLKSMVVYANKRFGTKRFGCRFWEKDKPNVESVKSFILRNGGQAFCRGYINDALAQRVMGRNVNTLDWQGYAPVIVYLNGNYHAMYELRERCDEDNIEANYGGLEDIDLVDYVDAEYYVMYDRYDELSSDYCELLKFIRCKHTFEQWSQMIDLESYADLFILRSWICDYDFPGNNQILWKRLDGDDTRWRWLLKDCDKGFGLYLKYPYNYNYQRDYLMRHYGADEVRDVYQMYYNLLECNEFREILINRTIARTGDFLKGETFNRYLDELAEESYGEQEISHAKWNQIYHEMGEINLRTMEYDYDMKREWINGRQTVFADILGEAMDLGEKVAVNVQIAGNMSECENLSLYYDDVMLTKPEFDGFDYVGRTIKLNTSGVDSNLLLWSVKVGHEDPVVYECDAISVPIVSATPINITLNVSVLGKVNGINNELKYALDPNSGILSIKGTCSDMAEVYDIQGRLIDIRTTSVQLPTRGVYVVNACGTRYKVIW